MVPSDQEVAALAWAYHSLSVVFGPNKPKHIVPHMEQIDAMIRRYNAQQVMKVDILGKGFSDTLASFRTIDLELP